MLTAPPARCDAVTVPTGRNTRLNYSAKTGIGTAIGAWKQHPTRTKRGRSGQQQRHETRARRGERRARALPLGRYAACSRNAGSGTRRALHRPRPEQHEPSSLRYSPLSSSLSGRAARTQNHAAPAWLPPLRLRRSRRSRNRRRSVRPHSRPQLLSGAPTAPTKCDLHTPHPAY